MVLFAKKGLSSSIFKFLLSVVIGSVVSLMFYIQTKVKTDHTLKRTGGYVGVFLLHLDLFCFLSMTKVFCWSNIQHTVKFGARFKPSLWSSG